MSVWANESGFPMNLKKSFDAVDTQKSQFSFGCGVIEFYLLQHKFLSRQKKPQWFLSSNQLLPRWKLICLKICLKRSTRKRFQLEKKKKLFRFSRFLKKEFHVHDLEWKTFHETHLGHWAGCIMPKQIITFATNFPLSLSLHILSRLQFWVFALIK